MQGYWLVMELCGVDPRECLLNDYFQGYGLFTM
jgi:hypothetical protein